MTAEPTPGVNITLTIGEVRLEIIIQDPQAKIGKVHAEPRPATEARRKFCPDKLRALKIKNNLSNSAVARRGWGTITDSRGYDVARNRDRIGHWLNGTSDPSPENLEKLAEALGVSIEELTVVVNQKVEAV